MDVSSIMIGAVIVVAMYGSLPALVAIWYAEDTSTRSLRYYVVAATAVAALLAFWLFAARMMFERYLPLLHILIAGPAAGAVWGVVYWGMAGRSAGEWKEHLAA
jgi:hypothetical protein